MIVGDLFRGLLKKRFEWANIDEIDTEISLLLVARCYYNRPSPSNKELSGRKHVLEKWRLILICTSRRPRCNYT